MDIEVAHTQTQDEAKRRIEGLIQGLKTRYSSQITDLKEHWSGYTGKIQGAAKGYSVAGSLDIKPDSVMIDLKIPFVLKVFSKKIRTVVEEQLKEALTGDGRLA